MRLRQKCGLFESVRQRLDQKNMARTLPGASEVLTPAFLPSKPDKNRRIVLTAIALVLGLGRRAGAAILRVS